MLISLPDNQHPARLALTELSNSAELIADLSYLADLSPVHLTLDFSHHRPPLTQARASQHIPAHFGYQPLDRLVEQVGFAGQCRHLPHLAAFIADISIQLPGPDTIMGQLFAAWGLPALLTNWGLPLEYVLDGAHAPAAPFSPAGRLILPTLTIVEPEDAPTLVAGIQTSLTQTVGADSSRVSLVSCLLENALDLLGGGLLAGLYFPATGYLEFSLMQYRSLAQGDTPPAQQAWLTALLESEAFARLHPALLAAYGSLCLVNGAASLALLTDGSFTAWTERSDLPLAALSSPRLTVTLQLPPRDYLHWQPADRVLAELVEQTTQARAGRLA